MRDTLRQMNAVREMRLLLWVLWIGLGVTATPVWAEDTVKGWLERISTAPERVDYIGSFIYQQGTMMETMRVVHSVRDGRLRERLYSLSGSAREIVRDEQQVWCYIPEQKVGVHEIREASESSFPNFNLAAYEKLMKSYQIELGKTGRIAGREARQLTITPMDRYRYGYRLWADTATGLVLHAELLTPEGELIEKYMFVDIAINVPINDEALKPVTPQDQLTWVSNQELQPPVSEEMAEVKIADLPEGFALAQTIRRISPMRRLPMEHRVFTDGLASISVFVEDYGEAKKQKIVSGASSMGAVHAYGRMVGDYQVTVVGEVPAETVAMIGRSVEN